MYRSEKANQTDIIVGEAVMELLNEGVAINQSALLSQLRKMAHEEQDSSRKSTITRALAEVRESMMALDHSSGEQSLAKKNETLNRNTKH